MCLHTQVTEVGGWIGQLQVSQPYSEVSHTLELYCPGFRQSGASQLVVVELKPADVTQG